MRQLGVLVRKEIELVGAGCWVGRITPCRAMRASSCRPRRVLWSVEGGEGWDGKGLVGG